MMRPIVSATFSILCVWGLLGGFVNEAWGCNVPVFRYALERWRPDYYQVIVFYDRELPKEQRELVDKLQLDAYDHPELGNVDALTADVNKLEDKRLTEIWKKQGTDAELPRAVVIAPEKYGNGAIVWSGALAKLDLENLRTSPARKELTRRLLAGDSVVWMVVASKQSQGVKEVQDLLTEQLKKLQDEIQLPAGIGDPGSELLSKIPLAVRFSHMLVDADNPAEGAFVESLLAQRTEEKSLEQPLVIPVFGRGRGLDVLTKKELTTEVIQDASAFLCAACSCRVKEQNPGFDLLLAAPWQGVANGNEIDEPSERTGPTEPQTIAIPPGHTRPVSVTHQNPPADHSHAAGGRSNEWWLVVVLSAAVCVGMLVLPTAKRTTSSH